MKIITLLVYALGIWHKSLGNEKYLNLQRLIYSLYFQNLNHQNCWWIVVHSTAQHEKLLAFSRIGKESFYQVVTGLLACSNINSQVLGGNTQPRNFLSTNPSTHPDNEVPTTSGQFSVFLHPKGCLLLYQDNIRFHGIHDMLALLIVNYIIV